jgi:hypothetical protein
MTKRRVLEWGGILAGAVLVVFGVVAIAMGVNGQSTVKDNLKAEQIYFGDAATDPTVPKKYSGQLVDNGAKARAFAKMMRTHTLESTSGKTYSQMGRYQAADGKGSDGIGGTNDAAAAKTDPTTKQPIQNSARNLWVTETALTTALNVSYMASQLALFGVVVGVALLLTGIGLVILAVMALGGAAALKEAEAKAPAAPTPATGH